MIYSPKKRLIFNFSISFILLFTVIVFDIITKVFTLPRVIWHSAFFLAAVVLCQLAAKYFLPVYTYCFDSSFFEIVKSTGQKSITVCKIDVSKIVSIILYSEYRKQETDTVRRIYNYNANVKPISCYVLIFAYSDCREAVIFEPSEEFIRALTKNL